MNLEANASNGLKSVIMSLSIKTVHVWRSQSSGKPCCDWTRDDRRARLPPDIDKLASVSQSVAVVIHYIHYIHIYIYIYVYQGALTQASPCQTGKTPTVGQV